MTYIDAHTHLDHARLDAAELVEAARRAGVTEIIQSGTDPESSSWAVETAERFDGVWATVGYHPHEAKEVEPSGLQEIERLAAHEKVLAIGEIGLDFYRNHSPRAVQEDSFVKLLRLARDVDLPVVIHTREAADVSIELLEREAADLTVVLHCFSLPDRVNEIAAKGWYMSFAGNVTFNKAQALHEAARLVPDHLLLVETDAPYLTPEPFRGKPNSPERVVETYRFLARLRGIQPEALGELVRSNARAAFPKLR